ncbi:adenosylmethionine-8-amino-7-oxononanoate aminotransferase [Pseudonocardia thermophila]|uniref:Adenosylmethionine-8-amino-7-oxononanoate aminotransferase n=1 Tax=Pseudonocardia thermophila TaxID=1848 RepID=A0A1M6ZVT5_PSETH|nr:adenosylmethionine--8-amino-7-oxononanoate transaminase [Pseudonocardia thermophila]SHL34550.1 adenosylmethionine-8-amino-7-oxononanoate aminotransferase [Pseudonocardia thermophila]
MNGLIERDRGLLWHPYASLAGPAPYAVLDAAGTRLELEAADGIRFTAIDAMSSWWCAIHGYRHPALDAAVREQIGRFSHVMFGGLTHEPAVRLAEQLVAITPGELQHVFLADSGSVSVEVALKLAVQYQVAIGRPQRRRFLALRGGYHGDTTGAMSICDPVDGMHALFPGLVAEQLFLPRPPAAPTADGAIAGPADVDEWAAHARRTAAAHAGELAAIVAEPVLQGAGGMHVYPPECLVVLREIADRHGLLLIVDEIATGFGRTGPRFAVDHAGITPDVLCVGKALTGGYLTLAAVLCTSAVARAVGALLHGPTFMGNPLACAVASASLELLPGYGDRIGGIAKELADALSPAAELRSVRDVRVLGAVGVVQLDRPVDVPAVTRAALERGAWVRPFRDLVYTMPPYVCRSDEIAAIGAAITGAVEEVHG